MSTTARRPTSAAAAASAPEMSSTAEFSGSCAASCAAARPAHHRLDAALLWSGCPAPRRPWCSRPCSRLWHLGSPTWVPLPEFPYSGSPTWGLDPICAAAPTTLEPNMNRYATDAQAA